MGSRWHLPLVCASMSFRIAMPNNVPVLSGTFSTAMASDGKGWINSIIKDCEDARIMILDQWGHRFEDLLFGEKMELPDQGAVVVGKMVRAVVEQSKFVMAFEGTSVTAGHDSWYEQGYPRVLDAFLKPIFNRAGVAFESRQGAMGNNPTIPSQMCVPAFAGLDVDVVGWEMRMMVESGECGNAARFIEQFARSAWGGIPGQPAILVMMAEPFNRDCTVADLGKSGPGRMPEFFGQTDCLRAEQDLTRAYAGWGIHGLDVERFVQNATCGDPIVNNTLLYVWGKGPIDKPWHPGPYGHQLVAHMIAVNYMRLLVKGLTALGKIAPGLTPQQLSHPARRAELLGKLGITPSKDVRGKMLPDPVLCDAWLYCREAENSRCATMFAPLNEPTLDLRSYVVDTRMQPEDEDKAFRVSDSDWDPTQWRVALNEQDEIYWHPQDAPPGFHYPADRKWVLYGRDTAGPISFKFTIEEGYDDHVTLCQPHFLKTIVFNDREGVRITADGNTTRAFHMDHSSHGPNTCFTLEHRFEAGDHILTLQALKSDPPLRISHLLWPA